MRERGVDPEPDPCAGYGLKRRVTDRLFGLRDLAWPVLDALDFGYRALRGRSGHPPLSYRQLVSGRFWASLEDFDRVGRELLAILEQAAGPPQGLRHLDIGSGCGRMALPLLEQLAGSGRYVGCDVDRRMVEWCRRNIAPRHANASFFHVDVHNSLYNPQARTRAADYRFPLDTASIDRITLVSVFTHMLPDDVQGYLREVARMLAPDGRAVAFVCMMSADRRARGRDGPIARRFPHHRQRHYVTSERYPEAEVAYDEEFLAEMIEGAALALDGPVHWGTWAGAVRGLALQDVLVLRRAP